MRSPRHLRWLLLSAFLWLSALSVTAQTVDLPRDTVAQPRVNPQPATTDQIGQPPLTEDKLGGADSSSIPFVPLIEYVEASEETEFGDDELDDTPGTKIDSLVHEGTVALNYCNDLTIHSGTFRVRLDLGDDYDYGTTAFSVAVSLKVQGIDTDLGDTVLLTHDPINLSINTDAPEQTYAISYSGADLAAHNAVDIYRVYVNSYSVSGGVDTAVRVRVSYHDEFSVDPIRPSPDEDQPMVYLWPIEGYVGGPHTQNPVEFIWQMPEACADRYASYQLQLLRLYNTDTLYQGNPYMLKAVVNWQEALTYEVAGIDEGIQSTKLTIPQGTGWYLWRVRPIGSLYEGGSADARNWGVWSHHYPDDTVLIGTHPLGYGTPADTSAFFYQQFEDTLVWAYSRVFTEGANGVGSRVGEGMTFVSPLGRPVQSQARSAENGTYMTANSVVDFQGRSTLGAMSAPTGNSAEGFKFRRNFFNVTSTDPYTAEDFDDDGNWDDPAPVWETTGSVSKYYNGTTTENGSVVPHAEDYPFDRTLLTTDGSARPKEIGGVGETYRIGGEGGGQERTTKIYYASASDKELVRLFGDEAPADTSVSKVLMLGPNKVTTVAWVSGGQVIATALQAAMGDTLLVALSDSSEPVLTGEITDTLRGNRTRGQLGVSSQKRYAFTEPTEITVTYHLHPNAVNGGPICVDTCTMCDYHVRLYVHNVDLKDSTKIFEHKLGGQSCDDKTDIDTTITLTLGPGTYIIERRLESGTIDSATIDADHPYGRSYADQFRDAVAATYREQVLSDDSVAAIMSYLDEKHLDSLYLYLGLNLDSLSTYGSVTVTTECCQITFPILDPDCGFDPCRDTVPDFEGYLFETWGADYSTTDLNVYFKFDGDQDVWPSGPGKPTHPFNTLVANMLSDTTATGGPLYECKKLWSLWVGLVDAWERLKQDPDDPENPSAFNPDFDLLDMFLQGAGRYLIDTSQTPYGGMNGYMSWAHRYAPSDVLSDSLCKAGSGYNVGWHGDMDSTDQWNALYNCWRGKNRTKKHSDLKDVGRGCDLSGVIPSWLLLTQAQRDDSCVVYSAARLEDECRASCESRRGEFAYTIMKAYEDAEVPISFSEAMCAADAIVDSCTGDCHLTILDLSSPIDSVGSESEWDAISRASTGKVEAAVPEEESPGVFSCSNDTMSLAEERTMPYEELIVDHLNRRVEEFWRVHGGTYWRGFMDAVREVAPDSIVARIHDSTVFVPPFTFDGTPPRFELRDGCKLWYVADTIFWSDLYPGEDPPMVTNLNAFLDGLWGMRIDSSVAGNGSDCEINGNDPRVRDYDFRTNADGLFTTYIEQPVYLVNGNVDIHDIDYYLSFPSVDETGVFYGPSSSGYLFGQFRMVGTGGNTDELSLRSVRRCVGSQDFVDITHRLADADSCGAAMNVRVDAAGAGFDSTGYGPASFVIEFTPGPGLGGLGNLLESFGYRYTTLFGVFGTTADGYLIYKTLNWNKTHVGPDTCRVFGIRFFGDPTRKLSDSICGLKSCPEICWRWVSPPPLDTTGVLVAPPPCDETAIRRIRSAINQSINTCIDRDLFSLRSQYEQLCGSTKDLEERITLSYPVDYIHFSLFYYDRAGRLVRTIPPKGVHVLADTATRFAVTDHGFASEYDYNALGQLVRTESPDAGESRFWYDRVGRLRFSQDARLAGLDKYAYTKFDPLGRVVEFGVSDDSITAAGFAADSNLENRDFPPHGSERTYLAYDTSSGVSYLDSSPQRFLRNRVSRTWTDDTVVTHFSYDVHGNVEWVAQEIPGFPRVNYTKYKFDLISGNINEVLYNEGRVDEFRHRYTYDADNALVTVETSHDGEIWDRDAQYEYYRNGPVRRVELGEDKLQGLDYTYTINGQLKAINDPTLTDAYDPGGDGTSTYDHGKFAADSFAVALHYHNDDFPASGPLISGGDDDLDPVPQYDGNISGMEVNVGKTTSDTGKRYEERTGESYRYDELGRLDSSRFHTFNTSPKGWNDFGDEYLTRYEYDANGNIRLLERRGYDQSGSTKMDSISYHYKGGDSNKLDYVFDAVPGDPYSEDIENTQSSGNYEYDENGNLTKDNDEGGMTLEWDSYGKVKEVSATPVPLGSPENISYVYDASGNRVKKRVEVFPTGGGGYTEETYYVYGAGGVVMAIYEKRCDDDAIVPPGGGPDGDGDGWPDGIDNCKATFNPDQRDSDGDGVGDTCDNCICTSNPGQEDANSNGKGDACEGFSVTDPDGDGYPANHDNCPCEYNPTQSDADNDGYGDACDECAIHLVELPIYGLGRIGVSKPDIDINHDLPSDTVYTRHLNEKYYELADHLGNVRAVLGDRKLTDTPGAGNYFADVRSYSHPYPFGMLQPGRSWDRSADTTYRYGYNGMEHDPEVTGETGNHYTTYFRQYDPRLGRWWSNDPIVHAGESPYAGMFNNPIYFSDPSGAEGKGGSSTTLNSGVGPAVSVCRECEENVPNPFAGYLYAGSDGWNYRYDELYGWMVDSQSDVVMIFGRRSGGHSGSAREGLATIMNPLPDISAGRQEVLSDAQFTPNAAGRIEEVVKQPLQWWEVAGGLLLGPVGEAYLADRISSPIVYTIIDEAHVVVTDELTGGYGYHMNGEGTDGQERQDARLQTFENVVVPFILGLSTAPAPPASPPAGGVGPLLPEASAGAAAGEIEDLPEWLQFHEDWGGHTIERHVGLTDEELIARMQSNKRITGASTFTDQATAESVTAKIISSNRPVIEQWLRSESSENLVLEHAGDEVIGRGLTKKGMRAGEVVSNYKSARIVLKRSTSDASKYFILTAFPIP